MPYLRNTFAFAMALLVGACAAPSPEIELRIASNGAYTLEGKAVTPEQLDRALYVRSQQQVGLVLNMKVATTASHESVMRAMEAVRAAHIASVLLATEAT